MARTKVKPTQTPTKPRPASTPEARENQLIGYAVDLAEQQLLDGTASSQVITHFLKLGTEKTKLETEKLKNENALLVAKTESINAAQQVDALYSEALIAMKRYSGQTIVNENEDDEDDEYY